MALEYNIAVSHSYFYLQPDIMNPTTNKATNESTWTPYTPTITDANVKLKSTSGIKTYYRSGWHIVTFMSEYSQEGKTVNLRAGYKRLTTWQSFKFLLNLLKVKLRNN